MIKVSSQGHLLERLLLLEYIFSKSMKLLTTGPINKQRDDINCYYIYIYAIFTEWCLDFDWY